MAIQRGMTRVRLLQILREFADGGARTCRSSELSRVADNAQRRELAAWYDAEELAADPPNPGRIPQTSRLPVVAWHLYQVLVDNRDETMLRMNGAGIFPGVHYADNTISSLCYRYADRELPAGSSRERTPHIASHAPESDPLGHSSRVARALVSSPAPTRS